MDNGFKVKAETGAAAGPDMLKAIESYIHPLETTPEKIERRKLDDATKAGLIERFDPAPDYLSHVAELFDLEAFKAAGYTLVCEPLYGSAGWDITPPPGGGKTQDIQLDSARQPHLRGPNLQAIPPY